MAKIKKYCYDPAFLLKIILFALSGSHVMQNERLFDRPGRSQERNVHCSDEKENRF